MATPTPPRRWTRWLPLLYLAFGFAWILTSDSVVGWIFRDTPHLLLAVGTAKGFAFVALTALMLAVWWRAEQRHNAALVAGAEARASFASERLAWMSRHAHEAILLLDADGRVIDCNERAELASGYSREQLLGMAVPGLIGEDAGAPVDEQLRTVLEHGSHVFETVHRTRDGALLPVEVSSSRVEFEGRTYVQCIVRDQSEILAARRRLERQRDLYDMLSRCSHAVARLTDVAALWDAVTRVAVQHGRFQFAWIAEQRPGGSVACAAAFGDDGGYLDQVRISTSPEEAKGQGPAGRCLRDGVTIVVNRFLDDPRTRPWHALAAAVGIEACTAVAIRVRGQVVAALMVYSRERDVFEPAVVRALEEISVEIGSGLDALQVRKELDESRNLLQTVIDASATPIYAFDREGRVLLMNEAAARVFGMSQREAAGLRRDVRLSPAETLAHESSDALVFESGETLYVEETVDQGGAARTFLSVKFPLRDLDGRIRAVGGVSTDITELRRAQLEVSESNARLEQTVAERTQELVVARDRAEQADRAKTAFLSTISHELRTPLNSIIGFTEIVLRELSGPLTEDQRRQLTIVQDSSHLLLDLINEILDLSRIEAGRMQFSFAPFDLAEVLGRRVDALASQAEAKGLELRCDLDGDHGTLTSDAKRVSQVVGNLLANAVKFTESGSVRLSATREGDQARIEVSDTGPGISEDDLEHLFKPFMQVGDGHHRHREGTGLGLAISRHLARALGGDISVESVLGHGTRFTVTLPTERSAPEESTSSTGVFRRLDAAH